MTPLFLPLLLFDQLFLTSQVSSSSHRIFHLIFTGEQIIGKEVQSSLHTFFPAGLVCHDPISLEILISVFLPWQP